MKDEKLKNLRRLRGRDLGENGPDLITKKYFHFFLPDWILPDFHLVSKWCVQGPSTVVLLPERSTLANSWSGARTNHLLAACCFHTELSFASPYLFDRNLPCITSCGYLKTIWLKATSLFFFFLFFQLLKLPWYNLFFLEPFGYFLLYLSPPKRWLIRIFLS